MYETNQSAILSRIVRELNEIKSSLRRETTNLPLYDVANENTPDWLTADQDNYYIGNYDVLMILSLLQVNITGLSGGVKGRYLKIFNVGIYDITFLNDSASSLDVNRIFTESETSVSIGAKGWIDFYYDEAISKWRSAGHS